jgi:cell division protein FtsB
MFRSTHRLRLALIVLILFGLFFVAGYAGRLAERARLEGELVGWQARVVQAQGRQAQLQAQLAYVQSDAHIHKQARERLGMVLPNDELVILVQRTPMAATPTPLVTPAAPAQPALAETPIWQLWWELFLPAPTVSSRP